jgi:hypothetical protein
MMVFLKIAVVAISGLEDVSAPRARTTAVDML